MSLTTRDSVCPFKALAVQKAIFKPPRDSISTIKNGKKSLKSFFPSSFGCLSSPPRDESSQHRGRGGGKIDKKEELEKERSDQKRRSERNLKWLRSKLNRLLIFFRLFGG